MNSLGGGIKPSKDGDPKDKDFFIPLHQAKELLKEGGWTDDEIHGKVSHAMRFGQISCTGESLSYNFLSGPRSLSMIPWLISALNWREDVTVAPTLTREYADKTKYFIEKANFIAGLSEDEKRIEDPLLWLEVEAHRFARVDAEEYGVRLNELSATREALVYEGTSIPWNDEARAVPGHTRIIWHRVSEIKLSYLDLMAFANSVKKIESPYATSFDPVPEGYVSLIELKDEMLNIVGGSGTSGMVNIFLSESSGEQLLVKDGKVITETSADTRLLFERCSGLLREDLTNGCVRGVLISGGKVQHIQKRYWQIPAGERTLSSGLFETTKEMAREDRVVLIEEAAAAALLKKYGDKYNPGANLPASLGDMPSIPKNVVYRDFQKDREGQQGASKASKIVVKNEIPDLLTKLKIDLKGGAYGTSLVDDEKVNLWAYWAKRILEGMSEKTHTNFKRAVTDTDLINEFTETTDYAEASLESQLRRYLGKHWYLRY